MRIAVLVPAHNESEQIADTVRSVFRQSLKPDLVTVVCDNCIDDTYWIARANGADSVKTYQNMHKKAGALNQALEWLLEEELDDDDAVLVMDADSTLSPGFVEHSVRYLDQGYSAVGGTFTGKPGGGFVGMLQRNEYARYARDVRRLKGKVLVLTGTATMFRVSALKDVLYHRSWGRLPGSTEVYDTEVLTEDSELTLALLHLGHKIIAPKECTLETEVMETWGDLAQQRLRWKRGAIENLLQYGFTRITAKYWARQLLSLLGVIVTTLYILVILVSLLLGQFVIQPIWLIVTGIFILERIVTVRSRGIWQMLLSAPLVIEMVFDIFLQFIQARAYVQALVKSERTW